MEKSYVLTQLQGEGKYFCSLARSSLYRMHLYAAIIFKIIYRNKAIAGM